MYCVHATGFVVSYTDQLPGWMSATFKRSELDDLNIKQPPEKAVITQFMIIFVIIHLAGWTILFRKFKYNALAFLWICINDFLF